MGTFGKLVCLVVALRTIEYITTCTCVAIRAKQDQKAK